VRAVFTAADFKIFEDLTLSGRLGKIQTQLDPKFVQFGQEVLTRWANQSDLPPQYFHMAKHLRRYKNPPVDTWLALSPNKRGYKMGPHIEVGFWNDRLFVWAAILGETKATPYRPNFEMLEEPILALSDTMVLSGDHTKKTSALLTQANFDFLRHRYLTTKAGEFMVGRLIMQDDPLFTQPEQLWQSLHATVDALLPVYQQMQGAILC